MVSANLSGRFKSFLDYVYKEKGKIGWHVASPSFFIVMVISQPPMLDCRKANGSCFSGFYRSVWQLCLCLSYISFCACCISVLTLKVTLSPEVSYRQYCFGKGMSFHRSSWDTVVSCCFSRSSASTKEQPWRKCKPSCQKCRFQQSIFFFSKQNSIAFRFAILPELIPNPKHLTTKTPSNSRFP